MLRSAFVVVVFGLALALAQTVDPTSNETLPFCDEEEIPPHPSLTDTPGSTPPAPLDHVPEEDVPIPNAQVHAGEVQSLINEITQSAVSKDRSTFGDSLGAKASQMATMAAQLNSRQAEINQIFTQTLPAVVSALDSRRKRAQIVRTQIKALNAKLRGLVDSLDRGGYVQEQQKFLNIIDSLMRIQNGIEMSALGASGTATVRPPAVHPANNALISISQEAMPKAAKDDASVLEMLHALDLLQVEMSTSKLSASKQVSLLGRKVTAILTRLIDIFNDMREKHKTYAKATRDAWSQELDLLQKQADDLSVQLETVVSQAEYYINAYQKHKQHLEDLVKQQQDSFLAYKATQTSILQASQDFNEITLLKAAQLRKFQELLHYLTYPNAPYTEAVFDFACDGVIGGNTTVDACGICGGFNSCNDCSGVPNGKTEMDVCGICGGGGKSCDYFCDGVPNSGKINDLCGVCGGNNTKCLGCDGIPNSMLVLDPCGVCGGDGSSCSANETPNLVPAPVPGVNQTVLVVKLQLGTPQDPDWVAKHGTALRTAVAGVVNVEVSHVQLINISGQDNVIVDMSILSDESAVNDVINDLTTFVDDGALMTNLNAQGISVTSVKTLEGPSRITG